MATWKRIITTDDDSGYKNSNVSTFSGNYNDLTNKPTVPTNNNQLTNGAGYTTNTGDITSVGVSTGLTGGGTSGAVTLKISTGGVSGNELATGAIDHPSKLANNVIGTNNIANSQITTAKIADEAVTGNEIESGTIESGHLSAGVINDSQLIGNDVINSQHYVNGSIDSAHVANGAITGTQLSTYAINSSAKLGSSVVTSTKIASNAVTTAKANLGWHTPTKIFIPPSAFTINDDNQYGNLGMVDNGGQARVMYDNLEAYANVPIPSGYKVTHWRVNGTSSVTVSLSYSTVAISGTTSAQAPAQQYTNNTNVTNPSSGISADDTNGRYMVIGWFPANTSKYLYGAVLTIANI